MDFSECKNTHFFRNTQTFNSILTRITSLWSVNLQQISTKSAEGATPNRAVRICLRSELAKKGCQYVDADLLSAVGATPNI